MKSFSGFKERDLSQPTSRILPRSRGTVVLIKKLIHQAQWPSTVLTEHKCKHSLFSSIHTKFRERCRYVTLYSGIKVDTGGAIHATKIQTGPTGKRGPPQKVDLFFRNFSGWTEPIHWVLDWNFRKFWLNGSRPGSLSAHVFGYFRGNFHSTFQNGVW